MRKYGSSNFLHGLQTFSSFIGFFNLAPFVHALCLFKALHLFFLTTFPGPTFISCSTSIPDSRVDEKKTQSAFLVKLTNFSSGRVNLPLISATEADIDC